MSAAQIPSPLVREVMLDLKAALAERFGARLREVRLFGSYARGEARVDSDLDVLVVLDRITGAKDRIAVAECAADVGLDRTMCIQALGYGEDEVAHRRSVASSFIDAVDREGISV